MPFVYYFTFLNIDLLLRVFVDDIDMLPVVCGVVALGQVMRRAERLLVSVQHSWLGTLDLVQVRLNA